MNSVYVMAAAFGEIASWLRRRKKMQFAHRSVRLTSFCAARNCLNIGTYEIETREGTPRLCVLCNSRYEDQCEREARSRARREVINQFFRIPTPPLPREFDFSTRPAPEMYSWMGE